MEHEPNRDCTRAITDDTMWGETGGKEEFFVGLVLLKLLLLL